MRGLLIAAFLATVACDSRQAEQQQQQVAPPVTFDGALVTEAAARVTHAKRISDVLGCTGCHGAGLQGQRFYEVYASNLTREIPKYTDAQLERLMREGVHPTGRDVWAMPSETFQHMSQPDMAALIDYLRTLRPAGPPTQARLPWEPEAEKMIAEGKLKPAAAWVAEVRTKAPLDLGSQHALGRYITRVTCAECHGPELKGIPGDTPDLIVAGGYSREEFEKLITQGVLTGNRKLKNELMADVARNRFAKLTAHERDALYAYLKARAEQQP